MWKQDSNVNISIKSMCVFFLSIEVADISWLWENVLLKNSENSQKNTCARVSFW